MKFAVHILIFGALCMFSIIQAEYISENDLEVKNDQTNQ